MMLSLPVARERAFRRAIETGRMTDLAVVHARQEREGYTACFGRSMGACPQIGCRWFDECMELMAFVPVSRLGHLSMGASENRVAAGGDAALADQFNWRAGAVGGDVELGGGVFANDGAARFTADRVRASVACSS